MDNVRIAVLSIVDEVLSFFDNTSPKAMHYYEDEFHIYLTGTAHTLKVTTRAEHEDSQCLTVGNKLAFRYRNTDYYMNIVSVQRDENEVTVEAWSNSLELLNEYAPKYSGTAMSFAQYLQVFDGESILTLGTNEVADKKISYTWEDTATVLNRLFSLGTVFNAELEIRVVLSKNYSLDRVVLNVYREHDEAKNVQGIGTNRTDVTIRYGQGVTGISKTADITDLYTAVYPVGKDGLSLKSLEGKTEYDGNGNVEYVVNDVYLRAPKARDRFPSNVFSNDRYILNRTEYDTDNVNVLYGQALAELKKGCVPQVSYEVEGYVDASIGDTFIISDEKYKPVLFLSARVTEQEIHFTDDTLNKTIFDNFVEKQSQIDESLISRMNELIAANKSYTCTISTDNGIVFKNGVGESTLTASVRDGVQDITGNLDIIWEKDNAVLSDGPSICVKAVDVTEKAMYRFEAKNTAGTVKGSCEITVTNVYDGEQGVPGDKGDKGDDGSTGPIGPPGESLSQGKMLYPDPTFAKGMNSVEENNMPNDDATSDLLVISRIEKEADCPTNSTHELKIAYTGGVASSGLGGFTFNRGTPTKANQVLIYRIIAKIPVGRNLLIYNNAFGTGSTVTWLTSASGTGKYKEYLVKCVCGATGSFYTIGWFSISGTRGTDPSLATWYLAYATCFDMTDVDNLQDKIDDVNNSLAESIKDLNATIDQRADSITSEVSEKYYAKTDTDRLIGEVSTQIKQTSESIDIKFTNQGERIDDINDATNSERKERNSLIRLVDGKIILGLEGSAITLVEQNDRISFMENGTREVAYFSNGKLFVNDGEFVNSLLIGKFGYIPRANGSLDFKKVK